MDEENGSRPPKTTAALVTELIGFLAVLALIGFVIAVIYGR